MAPSLEYIQSSHRISVLKYALSFTEAGQIMDWLHEPVTLVPAFPLDPASAGMGTTLKSESVFLPSSL